MIDARGAVERGYSRESSRSDTQEKMIQSQNSATHYVIKSHYITSHHTTHHNLVLKCGHEIPIRIFYQINVLRSQSTAEEQSWISRSVYISLVGYNCSEITSTYSSQRGSDTTVSSLMRYISSDQSVPLKSIILEVSQFIFLSLYYLRMEAT